MYRTFQAEQACVYFLGYEGMWRLENLEWNAAPTDRDLRAHGLGHREAAFVPMDARYAYLERNAIDRKPHTYTRIIRQDCVSLACLPVGNLS